MDLLKWLSYEETIDTEELTKLVHLHRSTTSDLTTLIQKQSDQMDLFEHHINTYSDQMINLQHNIRTHIRRRNHMMNVIQKIMETTTDRHTFNELEKLLVDEDTSSDEEELND